MNDKPKESAFQKRMREFHQVREQLAADRAAAKQKPSTDDGDG